MGADPRARHRAPLPRPRAAHPPSSGRPQSEAEPSQGSARPPADRCAGGRASVLTCSVILSAEALEPPRTWLICELCCLARADSSRGNPSLRRQGPRATGLCPRAELHRGVLVCVSPMVPDPAHGPRLCPAVGGRFLGEDTEAGARFGDHSNLGPGTHLPAETPWPRWRA